MHCLEISEKILVDFNKDFSSLSYFTSSMQLVTKNAIVLTELLDKQVRKLRKKQHRKRHFISDFKYSAILYRPCRTKESLTVEGPVTQV